MKQNGIALLEALLALVIAAIVITMSVRYFTVTRRDMRVTHAVNQIRILTRASYAWLNVEKQANFSSNPSGNNINLQSLIADGLIQTDKQGNYWNPWGGNVLVAPGRDPSYVSITLQNIPLKACMNLAQQLITVNREVKSIKSMCHSASNSYEGEF